VQSLEHDDCGSGWQGEVPALRAIDEHSARPGLPLGIFDASARTSDPVERTLVLSSCVTDPPGLTSPTLLCGRPPEQTTRPTCRWGGSTPGDNWFAFEFWRFVDVQQEVAKAAQTFLGFPPMQKGPSFNPQALKEELEKRRANQQAQ